MEVTNLETFFKEEFIEITLDPEAKFMCTFKGI